VTRLGADPHDLQSAATRLDASAARLREVQLRTDHGLAAAWWIGADANRFRHRWHRVHRPALGAAALACTTRAQQLRLHALEQDRASQSAGTAERPSRATGTLAGVRFDPLPRRVETGTLRVEGGVALLSLGATADVTIEHLADGRRRVSVTDRVSAGVGAAATATVAGAAEHERVGPERTRTWTVDAHDVSALLGGVLVDELVPGGTAASIGVAARLADTGLAWLGLDTPLDRVGPPPPAESTEILLRAADGGSVRIGGADASSSGSVAVGLRSAADGPSLVVAWSQEEQVALSGTLAGQLRRQLGVTWTPPAGARITGRIQVPVAALGADPPTGQVARIEFTSELGREQSTVRAVVDVDAIRSEAPQFLEAIEQLAAGRAGRAAALMSSSTLPPGSVAVEIAAGRIEATSIDVPISGGLGSLSPGLEGRVLTRR